MRKHDAPCSVRTMVQSCIAQPFDVTFENIIIVRDVQLNQRGLALPNDLVEVVRVEFEDVGRERAADGQDRREESAEPHNIVFVVAGLQRSGGGGGGGKRKRVLRKSLAGSGEPLSERERESE